MQPSGRLLCSRNGLRVWSHTGLAYAGSVGMTAQFKLAGIGESEYPYQVGVDETTGEPFSAGTGEPLGTITFFTQVGDGEVRRFSTNDLTPRPPH